MRQKVKLFFGFCAFAGTIFLSGCQGGKENLAHSSPPAQKSTMETLSVYTIDSDTMTLVPIKVKKGNEELTPEYVTSLVENNLDDSVRVYSVEQEDNRLILSFYADGKPFVNCSKKMENLILDCFANSLLDNLDDCSEIVFRCEKKPYKSEHYSFKLNEVYSSE